jgi:signal transduction histidine kinase
VDLYGGSISVERALGCGSEFIIELPNIQLQNDNNNFEIEI